MELTHIKHVMKIMYMLMINKIITNSFKTYIYKIERWHIGPLKHNTMKPPGFLQVNVRARMGWPCMGFSP